MTNPDEATVVPIAVTVKGRTGYTIWAPPWVEDGEEWQAFLGAGSRIWLFESLDDLADTLATGLDNDLADHPGWPMLQTLPVDQLQPDEDYFFDLDDVPDLTLADASEQVVDQVTESVDIIERIAECCEHSTLLRLLEQPGFADLLGPDECDAWTEIRPTIRTAWPLLLDRLAECVEWRTAHDLPATSTVDSAAGEDGS